MLLGYLGICTDVNEQGCHIRLNHTNSLGYTCNNCRTKADASHLGHCVSCHNTFASSRKIGWLQHRIQSKICANAIHRVLSTIIPVDATSTSAAVHPTRSATDLASSSALLIPSLPVATLAFLDTVTMARGVCISICRRERRTLGPANRERVKTASALHLPELAMITKSSVSSLIPIFATCVRNPRGVGMFSPVMTPTP